MIKIEEKAQKKELSFLQQEKKGAKTGRIGDVYRQLRHGFAGVFVFVPFNSMAKHAESANFRDTINAVIKDIEGGLLRMP